MRKLDLSVLEPYKDRFVFVEKDGLTLIFPRLSLTPTEWKGLEHFRSIVIDEDNNIVSMAFPKFFNFGESLDDSEDFVRALDDDRSLKFTLKFDGSLIIRSVINGKVVFRTRGTLDGGDFGVKVRTYLEALEGQDSQFANYLLNPLNKPYLSILLEYIAPDNRIVIPYEEESLVYLGYSDHSTLKSYQSDLASFLSIEELRLTRNKFELAEEIRNWTNFEGIVAVWCYGAKRIKIKSDWYINLHRLKSLMTPKAVKTLAVENKIDTIFKLKKYITDNGGDWELLQGLEPIFNEFKIFLENVRERLDSIFKSVQNLKVFDRKIFAVNYANLLPSEYKGPAFMFYDDHSFDDVFWKTVDRIWSQQNKEKNV